MDHSDLDEPARRMLDMLSMLTTATAVRITALAIPEAGGAFGVLTITLLIVLLVTKEIARASRHPIGRRFDRAVNVATAPLLIAVGILALSKVLTSFN